MTATDLVIFGANGDLSARKLFPALFHLHVNDLLPKETRILAVARNGEKDAFLERLKGRIEPHIAEQHWTAANWQSFAERCSYIQADLAQPDDYGALAEALDGERINIFYLATPPGLFADICDNLAASQCLDDASRIVLEKPIGQDLASCVDVNERVARHFDEQNIYRIDHYLGKETVQNLLVLRFGNRFINAQWDQSCIDHVQITVAESVGIEGRWSYYDAMGQLRDMVQNHLMQLLCLVAMEPPNAMTAESIIDEKLKIVRALRRIDEASVADQVVRGQYSAGTLGGLTVPGYLEEKSSQTISSDTETFVALKVFIDNWRWASVPFYLRTGKRLPEKTTEIVITYKALPHNIFHSGDNSPNRLVIRLQPNEGIEMQMVAKRHSLRDKMSLATQTLNLDFMEASGVDRIPDAYERLFLDVIGGDRSLFVGREEIEESWRWCDALIQAWQNQELKVWPYQAGSWGPTKADLLIEKDGRSWNEQ